MSRTWWYFISFYCNLIAVKDIFITGPKHSGKTSSGKTLAHICSLEFIDLDELIFQQTGKTPRQLFLESKAAFQKAETDALKFIFKNSNDGSGSSRRVIAAGGGIIDNPEAAEILKNTDGIIIYLDISAHTAWSRIVNSNGGELPPFLKSDNPQKTSEDIHRELHERRAAEYLRITGIVIKAEGKTPEEIAAEIQNKTCLKIKIYDNISA